LAETSGKIKNQQGRRKPRRGPLEGRWREGGKKTKKCKKKKTNLWGKRGQKPNRKRKKPTNENPNTNKPKKPWGRLEETYLRFQ